MASGRPDYTSQALIKGNCTGVGILTVAVDSAGNILGVLKGDYAGSLKTLAVDDQGRMLAVLTDPEDVFGNPHYMGAAELAVRLGAVSRYDRRGQVLFADPGGLNAAIWAPTTSGTGSSWTEFGQAGLALPTSYYLSAGPTNGNYSQGHIYVPKLMASKCGVEWCFISSTVDHHFEVYVDIRNGTAEYYGAIRLDKTDNHIYYYGSDSAWHDLQLCPHAIDNYTPHVWKLVLDETAGKYVRLTVDRTEIDMSSLSLCTDTSVLGPYIQVDIRLYCGTGGTLHYHLGEVLVTGNEE